jgi:AcrR family transcriptional regulator
VSERRGSTSAQVAASPERSYRQQSLTARRQDQYRRLIRAGRDMFAEHGYAGTSIEDIVARARVSRTSFYRFFSNKEDCLLAVFRAGTERGLEALEKVAASDLPPEEKLREGVRAFVALLAADAKMSRVTLLDAVGATPLAEQARLEVRERFATIIEDFLHQSGLWQDRPEIEVRLVAIATMAGVGQAVSYLIATDRLAEWQEAVAPLAAYAIRALIPPDETGGA